MKTLLARGGYKVVGFAANRKVDATTVELAGIVVSERSTGKGIGTSLVNASIEAASAGGYEEMTVKTETFNERAIGFYETNGFRRIRLSSEELKGKKVDSVVPRRGLDNKRLGCN